MISIGEVVAGENVVVLEPLTELGFRYGVYELRKRI